ncbi:MAG TPA: glycosyltransferase family 4 protein [bacterium]|nr:glycosyltransferase family 4 protein [bacterium]
MKIIYITNARIPTEKAHGLQIIKTCEALANLGVAVELIAPTRKNYIMEDVFSFYHVKNNFKITYFKSFDFFRWHQIIGHLSFILNSLTFLLTLRKNKLPNDSVVYTRQPEIAWLMLRRGYKVFFEAHRWPESKNKLFKFLLKNIAGVIGNSQGTVSEFTKRGWKNVLVAQNGVDLDDFNVSKTKTELREIFSLPVTKKIVLYLGHFYDWKGVDSIIATAEKMIADTEIFFVLAGGTTADINQYQKIINDKNLTNVLLLGFQKHQHVPPLLKSADILLLPNIPISEESKYQTSPIKMFEYMATGVPIIASDLPSIKEILNEHNALLVPPSNINKLAPAIKHLLQNQDLAVKISTQALTDVKQYSWQKRAEKILKFAQNYRI